MVLKLAVRFNIYNHNEELITTLETGKNSGIINLIHNKYNNSLSMRTSNFNEYFTEGNYLGFLDTDNIFQLFEIKKITALHDKNGLFHDIYAEHVLYELLDEVVTDVADNLNDAAEALTRALRTTRFRLGTSISTSYHPLTFNYETALAGLNKIKTLFNVNLRYRITTEDNTITGRYVDIISAEPKESGKRFVFSKDLLSVKRDVDCSRIFTALYGKGKSIKVTPSADNLTPAIGERLNFINEEWATPTNPVNKPAGQEWVGDDNAKNLWGRGSVGAKRHRFGIVYFDNISDPKELLKATYAELLNYNKPSITYTLNAIDLETIAGASHEAVRMNDSVIIIDDYFTPALECTVSVTQIISDLLNPQNTKIVLGSPVKNMSDLLRKLSSNQQRLRDKESAYDIVSEHFDEDGKLNTEFLDGTIDALTHQIIASGAYQNVTPLDNKGLLFENTNQNSPDYGALYLGPGIFAIANTKENGKWKWRTFGTGAGFTADLITAGKINAALIKTGILTSNNGTSWINMDNGSFNLGSGALTFDGAGNSNFSGYIKSERNNRCVFIDGSITGYPAIGFEISGDNTGYIYSKGFDNLTVYGAGTLELSAETNLKLTTPKITLNNGSTAYTGSVTVSGRTLYFNNGILYNVV